MDREAHPLGLTINWAKTEIQNLGDLDGVNRMHYATVQGNQVEVVQSFTYLGSLIRCSGSSEPEIKRRANVVREAMSMLDQNIWRSCITLETSCAFTTRVFSRYSYMELRHCRWPRLYRGRLAQNRGGWPAANESRTSDSKATRPGQIGMAATCGNGYVFDKLLKRSQGTSLHCETTDMGIVHCTVPVYALPITGTHCDYPRRHGQDEWTKVAGLIPKLFTRLPMVTHPTTEQAQRHLPLMLPNHHRSSTEL